MPQPDEQTTETTELTGAEPEAPENNDSPPDDGGEVDSDAEWDRHADEVLNEIEPGGDDDDDEDSDEPTSTVKDDETDPDEEPESSTDADEKPASKPDDVSDEAWNAALEALRRDNWSDEMVQLQLAQEGGAELLLQHVERIGKRQGDNDKDYGELKRLRGDRTDVDSEKPDDESGTADPGASQKPPADLAAILAPVRENFGDEAADALGEYTTAAVTKTTEALQGTIEQLEARHQHVTGMLEGLLITQARGSLRERYPEVDDDKNWQDIQDEAYAMAERGYQAPSLERMLEDATKLKFADAIRTRGAAARKAETTRRNNGTAELPSPARSPRSDEQKSWDTMTEDERDDATLSEIEATHAEG